MQLSTMLRNSSQTQQKTEEKSAPTYVYNKQIITHTFLPCEKGKKDTDWE